MSFSDASYVSSLESEAAETEIEHALILRNTKSTHFFRRFRFSGSSAPSNGIGWSDIRTVPLKDKRTIKRVSN